VLAIAQTGKNALNIVASSHFAYRGSATMQQVNSGPIREMGAAYPAHAEVNDGLDGGHADVVRCVESPNVRSVSSPIARVYFALVNAKKQLWVARNENAFLKKENERLERALCDASRRGSEANRLAHHDMLTGLPNRLLLIERLQQEIGAACRNQRQLALLFIDLDGFKEVNDGYGHMVGDRLLTSVARRINACIRGDDFACRYGGDEFVVLLTNVSNAESASEIAENICRHINFDYMIDGMECRVAASVGSALYPADGGNVSALLSHADASMYRSKAEHRVGRKVHDGSSSLTNSESL
jgi:diguanylate cyclase (GGDEF)-like protein